MKHYKLLKDTPTIKAGTIFEEAISDFDGAKELVRITPVGAKTNPQWTIQDIDNFGEWFEGIEEEPVDSAHWRPEEWDPYFYIDSDGNIASDTWHNTGTDNARYELGHTYQSYTDCKKALDCQLAEATLRRSSTFKPDFENGTGGWSVVYDHLSGKLIAEAARYTDCGQLVWFETYEDAMSSIKKYKKEWLTYFGVENA